MGLFDAVGSAASGIGSALEGGFNALDKAVNGNNGQVRNFEENGFIVPPIPAADGNGLPSSKIPSPRQSVTRRHIMRFFVPEVGIINMYINPQSINYTFKKLITQERTKGGYVMQYWGEELPTLSLRGHTGSSGVEGLNVLYEVYRSEQLTFDATGLTLASDNSISGLGDLIDNALGGLGDIGGAVSSLTNGALDLNPLSQSLLPAKPLSLAELAFGIEIFYNGWVFRGFFTSFNFTESVERLGLFEYDIQFTVTQRRGYRTNYLPWQRSAINGPSNNSRDGGIPLTFDGPPKQRDISKNPFQAATPTVG